MQDTEKQLDREVVSALAEKLGKIIADHYEDRPCNLETVLETLNALAWLVGGILSGTDNDAVHFFNKVVNETLFDTRAAHVKQIRQS